jgi:hypothetical protein
MALVVWNQGARSGGVIGSAMTAMMKVTTKATVRSVIVVRGTCT